MTKLGAILDQIDSGTTLLPEFQRGYVWNRDQVRGLMRSLYRGYPVGGLLVWEAEAEAASVRGSSPVSGVKQLLLDGQQLVTSLYGIVRGGPPEFFEGDPAAFTGLRFNVEDETFEFFAPAKMRDDRRWVDVTSLFINGLELEIGKLNKAAETQPKIVPYMTRLARLRSVLDREFHIEKITGADKSVDVVVDIFNRVNAGGTKLSKGDLALAKICAQWPEARGTMRGHLARWREAGYAFSLDWLLRNANAVATGRAPFSALEDITTQEFQDALASSAKYVGGFLDAVCGRLGLDHDRVLMGRYAFPVVSRFLHLSGGRFADAAERDQMLYWYVQTALWGRFTGSTETVLAQDYETLEISGIDGLVTAIARARGGNLTIGGHDFEGFGRGSRFYPLLYLLTRVRGARDFGTGLELKREMLGHLTSLQVHHIFPKAYLYKAGYTRGQVNAVANFCFLTQETNLTIGQRAPEAYLTEVEAKHPGTLASQWIPADPDLWKPARYLDFLAARRQLLADAANGFLTELRSGAAAPSAILLERLEVSSEDVEVDERAIEVKRLVEELTALGYGEPALDAEIADPVDGHVLAVAEAVWPEGLQSGQGNPVVLELDPADADLPRLEELGYEVFTKIESLRGYARRRNEVAAGLVRDEGAVPVPMPDSASERDSNAKASGRRWDEQAFRHALTDWCSPNAAAGLLAVYEHAQGHPAATPLYWGDGRYPSVTAWFDVSGVNVAVWSIYTDPAKTVFAINFEWMHRRGKGVPAHMLERLADRLRPLPGVAPLYEDLAQRGYNKRPSIPVNPLFSATDAVERITAAVDELTSANGSMGRNSRALAGDDGAAGDNEA